LVEPSLVLIFGTDILSSQHKEPTQRRGKIAARHAPHPTRITIKGDLMRTSIGLQKADHRFHRGLFVEILSGLGKQGDRGASIHKIAHLDHMLALADAGLCSADTLLTSLKSI